MSTKPSFTYSGDPSASELDALRFAIGDTDADDALLQDAEINYIIATTAAGAGRYAAVFRHAATMVSIRPTKRSLGPQSEDISKRQAYFANMATKYEKIAGLSGTPPLPEYQHDLVFEKGMMKNDV